MKRKIIFIIFFCLFFIGFTSNLYAYDYREGNLNCLDCHIEGTVEQEADFSASGGLHNTTTDAQLETFSLFAAEAQTLGTSDQNISNTASGSGLCSNNGKAVCVDKDDNIHAVWHDSESGSWEVYYSKKTPTGSWSTKEMLSDSGDTSVYPVVAVDSTNNVYVVWEDYQHKFGPWLRPEIYMNKWNGTSWDGPTLISTIDYITSGTLPQRWMEMISLE